MSSDQDYAALVAKAEKAVAAVKDPDLKRIAFQKVLDNLLSEGAVSDETPALQKKAQKKTTQKAKSTPSGSSGPKAYVEGLIEEKFFKKPKTISQVKAELENLGHHIPITSLSGPLQRLCQQRRLRRQKLADSGTYAYSEW